LGLKFKSGKNAKLNFICTHNSRRSKFTQIRGAPSADYYSLPIEYYSEGVEVTKFYPRAIKSLKKDGFLISKKGGSNPIYAIKTAVAAKPYF